MFEAPRAYIRFVCSFSFLSSLSPYIYNIFAINPIQSIFRQFLLRFCFSLYSLSSYGLMSMISYEVMMTTLMLLEPESLFHHHFFFTSALTIFVFSILYLYLICVFVIITYLLVCFSYI